MKNAVERHFDNFSSAYEDHFSGERSGKNFEFGKRIELLSNYMIGQNGSLLDCACGSGDVTLATIRSANFQKITLLDLSQNMLDISMRKFDNLELECIFKKQDIFSYSPKSDTKYDVILCIGLVAHTGRLEELLAILKSLLSPTGFILFQTTLYDHLGTRMLHHFSKRRFRKRHQYEISYYTEADIEKSSEAAGLYVESKSKYCLGIPYGDLFFPWINYSLEKLLQRMSGRTGSEAIYKFIVR